MSLCLSPGLAQMLLALQTGSLAIGVSAAGSGADLVGPPVQTCPLAWRCPSFPLTDDAVGNAVCEAGGGADALSRAFHDQDP